MDADHERAAARVLGEQVLGTGTDGWFVVAAGLRGGPPATHAFVVLRIARLGADVGFTEPLRDEDGELVRPDDLPGDLGSAILELGDLERPGDLLRWPAGEDGVHWRPADD